MPTSWFPFDNTTKLNQQFDQVVEWFNNDTFNYDLALLYFLEPDMTGHYSGPESENISAILKYIDDEFGKFRDRLKRMGEWDRVSIADYHSCNY